MNIRGSAMIEAAIIFPFVLLSILGIIVITLFMYNEIVTTVDMQMALKCKSAEISKTSEMIYDCKDEVMLEGVVDFSRALKSSNEINIANDKFLLARKEKVINMRSYIINEKNRIFLYDFLKETNEENSKG